METQGFRVSVDDDAGHGRMSQYLGVPASLRSPNLALVQGYVVSGHVPAEDILQLLSEHPNVRGIAVPGRPGASPGMEDFSAERKPYEVVVFEATGGVRRFAQHGSRETARER